MWKYLRTLLYGWLLVGERRAEDVAMTAPPIIFKKEGAVVMSQDSWLLNIRLDIKERQIHIQQVRNASQKVRTALEEYHNRLNRKHHYNTISHTRHELIKQENNLLSSELLFIVDNPHF